MIRLRHSLRLLGAICLLIPLLLSPAAHAQKPEKPTLTLGVGGKPLLYYLPLTLAERLGYFRDAGLSVEIDDFGGGAKALQALIGGSVDAVTGAFEHTIQMQPKGQDIRAVIELGRYPGLVLAVASSQAGRIRTIADLKGARIGVTAPGSSTHMFVRYLLAQAGLPPDAASIIGVGAGASAVAAIEQDQVQAIAHLDPVIAKLEAENAIHILADTRTSAGTSTVFGGENPAAVLYVRQSFIDQNPATTQALVDAFWRALVWLHQATPEQIADIVPESYWLGDKALYLRATASSLPGYSVSGEVTPEGQRNALKFIAATNPGFDADAIDLGQTFDGSFLARAKSR